jgi:hypothetical protein
MKVYHDTEGRLPNEQELQMLLENLKRFSSERGLAIEYTLTEHSYSVSVYPVAANAPIETEWILRPDGLWRRTSKDRRSSLQLISDFHDPRGSQQKS